MTFGFAMLIVAALATSATGLFCAWWGWRSRGPRLPLFAATLALWALSTALWVSGFGTEIGIPLALETAALVAFGFILTRIERRDPKVPRERVTPPPASVRHRRLRGLARFLIGGPLGLVAALGVGILVATQGPGAEQTRLILSGLIVPSLWCVGIAWTVSDRRLLPPALGFAALGATGFGLAFVGGA